MRITARPGKPWLAILLAALLLRLGGAIWWNARVADHRFAFPDSAGYWHLAREIARQQPYAMPETGDRVFRTPGYPMLLAPLFLLSDEPPVLWGRLVSVVAGTLTVGAVYGLARRYRSVREAWIAGGLAVIYPGAVAMSAFVLTEAPFCLLMLWQLRLACRLFVPAEGLARPTDDGRAACGAGPAATAQAARAPGRRASRLGGIPLGTASLVGALAGIATLIRPSWLLFWPLTLAFLMACSRQRRVVLAHSACLLATLIATMLPWWIRNYRLTERFVPTSLQVGASLYDGLRPGARGESNMDFVPEFRRLQREADEAAEAAGKPLASTFEYRLDRRLRIAATAWASQHPRRVGELVLQKLRRMWNLWPNEAAFGAGWMPGIAATGYLPVMLLATRGCWLCYRGSGETRRLALVCVWPAIYFTLMHIVFVASIRYREPAMLPLLVMAAVGTNLRLGDDGRDGQPARKDSTDY